jgi:hypothetical protein
MYWLSRPTANDCASARACWNLLVNLSCRMRIPSRAQCRGAVLHAGDLGGKPGKFNHPRPFRAVTRADAPLTRAARDLSRKRERWREDSALPQIR